MAATPTLPAAFTARGSPSRASKGHSRRSVKLAASRRAAPRHIFLCCTPMLTAPPLPHSRREAAPAVEAPASNEPMDVNQAVRMVLKKALAHDGLSRGLHEVRPPAWWHFRALHVSCVALCGADMPWRTAFAGRRHWEAPYDCLWIVI